MGAGSSRAEVDEEAMRMYSENQNNIQCQPSFMFSEAFFEREMKSKEEIN
jgi:hypothetical protein